MAYDFISPQGQRYLPSRGITSFFQMSKSLFQATICASVNEEIVHGIPGGRVLKVGDIISLDCGAIYRGWQGDSAHRGCGEDLAPSSKGCWRRQRPLWRRVLRRQSVATASATYRTPLSSVYCKAANMALCANMVGMASGAGSGKSLLCPITAAAQGSSFGRRHGHRYRAYGEHRRR